MIKRLSIFCGLFLALPLLAGTLSVADYGAVGDAVQLYVNCTSNSVLVTTTNAVAWPASTNDTIEVMQAGAQTYGQNSYGTNAYGNQDLVATITNVVNGTNIYLSQIAKKTLTNTFATYGTDNTPAFSNTIAAGSGYTNVVVNIPNGTYLLMPTFHTTDGYFYSAIAIHRGGLHFVGQNQTNTILLSRGAWTIQNGGPDNGWTIRGFLFEIVAPITNDYPFSIENLTLDGGVQQGNTAIHGIYINPVDGQGWDTGHSAYLTCDGGNNTGTATHQVLTNVTVQHWRGEMLKSIDGNRNGNLNIFNCLFTDGNATAINIYPSLNISNCVFANLFQVAEYYQAYSTNTSYFQNNLVTNITGNGFAIDGGKGNNPPFVIQNNTLYFSGNGYNGIETMPGDNVSIISNQFVYPVNSHGIAIDLGATGAQGTFESSNIVIAYNNFVQASMVVELGGGSPTDPTDPNRVEDVQVYGNSLTPTPDGSTFLLDYGWVTNVNFSLNSVAVGTDPVDGINRARFTSGAGRAQYVWVDTNNLYYSPIGAYSVTTNYISYANGSRYEIPPYGYIAGAAFALTDNDSNQIPPGAQILIWNNFGHDNQWYNVPVYLNSACTSRQVIITNGMAATFSWSGSQWTQDGWIDTRARVHW